MKLRVLGIDATNIRGGGGVTHLFELLRSVNLADTEFDRVVVWGGSSLLSLLEDRVWLIKRNPAALDKGLVKRILWQRYHLTRAAYDEGCSLLFVPGGSYAGGFHPVVTMSQNLLPFQLGELFRYGWTLFTLKLLLLRLTQSQAFKKCEGVIFLTEYARNAVENVTGKLSAKTCVVPHGVNPRFYKAPNFQKDITSYNNANPFRVIYVSTVDLYKHQWHVISAIEMLREKGLPIVIDLIGPAYQPALKRLNSVICLRDWACYYGAVPFDFLHKRYADADLGIFASSCENMPNILLENMASGLPIACSNKGPMPEILGQNGLYFDPERPEDIARVLLDLIESPNLRTKLAQESYVSSQKFNWQDSATNTFRFFASVMTP